MRLKNLAALHCRKSGCGPQKALCFTHAQEKHTINKPFRSRPCNHLGLRLNLWSSSGMWSAATCSHARCKVLAGSYQSGLLCTPSGAGTRTGLAGMQLRKRSLQRLHLCLQPLSCLPCLPKECMRLQSGPAFCLGACAPWSAWLAAASQQHAACCRFNFVKCSHSLAKDTFNPSSVLLDRQKGGPGTPIAHA